MAAATYTVVEVPKMDSGAKIGPQPLNVLEGGYIKQLSFNPFDGGTFKSVGNSHEQGGIMVDSTGNGRPDAEIEGNETIHTSGITGEKYVGGNLTIPGTKKKFKQAFTEIAREEEKASKMIDKGNKLVQENDPENKYKVLSHNSGSVMSWSAMNKQKALAATKEELAQTQQAIHEVADTMGITPKELNKNMKMGGKFPIARDGYKTGNEAIFKALEKNPNRFKYVDWAKEAAEQAGIEPGDFHRLLFRESGFNPNAKSGVGARGIAQFMPKTYKDMGGNPADFGNTSEESIRRQLNLAAQHYKQLQDSNNGDPALAAIAYNGGPGAIDFVKKETKNPNLTGSDWLSFMEQRRQSHPTNKPNAWQNQTYNYVKALSPDFVSNEDFYAGRMPKDVQSNEEFQKQFYSRPGIPEMQPLSPVESNYQAPVQPFTAPNPSPVAVPGTAEVSKTSPFDYRRPPSLADNNKLGIGQILPEIAALGERPGFVPHQSLAPTLFQPYNVSFQDRLNQNNSSFKSLQGQLVNNPEALSVLAAQKYNADNGVMADQFRTNQQIDNDITNKNIALINQTREKNLQLNDQQFVRQEQGRENTRANWRAAANSITSKVGQNRLENNEIRMQEGMANYRYNPHSGQIEYVGPKVEFTANGQVPYDPNAELITKKMVDSEGKEVTTTTTKRKPFTTRRFWGGRIDKKWKF